MNNSVDHTNDLNGDEGFRLKSFKFRWFDQFGNTKSFHVRGSQKHQTKVGAICTIIYLVLIVMAFVFYIVKFNNTSDPIINRNIYHRKFPINTILAGKSLHLNWSAYNALSTGTLGIQEFLENLTAHASVLTGHTVVDTVTGQQREIKKWITVPLVPCIENKWIKEINAGKKKDTLERSLCIKEDVEVNIRLYNNIKYEYFNVIFLPCQADNPYNIVCKNVLDPRLIFLTTQVARKIIDVNKYSNPTDWLMMLIDTTQFNAVSKNDQIVWTEQTELITNAGIFGSSVQTEYLVKIRNSKHATMVRSDALAPRQSLSQGRTFTNDWYMHQRYQPTNKIEEVKREYFTILDVFSSVGGLIQFFSIVIYFLYNAYNGYDFVKNLIQKAIVGKESLYSNQYRFKQGFCRTYFRHTPCCCYFGCSGRDEEEYNNTEEGRKYLQQKYINMWSADKIIKEKTDQNNFLSDSMDFNVIRQQIVKSRHKLMIPILTMNMYKNQAQSGGFNKKKSRFEKNIDERDDVPVFSVEDAVQQMKSGGNNRNKMEKQMDEFFLKNLPVDIVGTNEQDNEPGQSMPMGTPQYMKNDNKNNTNGIFVKNKSPKNAYGNPNRVHAYNEKDNQRVDINSNNNQMELTNNNPSIKKPKEFDRKIGPFSESQNQGPEDFKIDITNQLKEKKGNSKGLSNLRVSENDVNDSPKNQARYISSYEPSDD